MRTVFVLFDSLNRKALSCYNPDAPPTPNFDRFATRSARFEKHYVGSLPCIPARRDLHTGRMNFMHRSWGPLEPFDNSFAAILGQAGVYSHLVTDHLHYFEDGGTGYHTRFTSYAHIRGQEYDPWIPVVRPDIAEIQTRYSNHQYDFQRARRKLQHALNREAIVEDADFPIAHCFAGAFDFLDRNRGEDDWHLMLECFDPHEPFHAPERFKKKVEAYDGKILDWPHYDMVSESLEEIAEIRANYFALVSMCDEWFGRLLDYFDAHDLWDDTALILTTDHGFLLGEQEWWGKCRMPYYEEISHIPLIVHDPRRPGAQTVGTLTQTADIMPMILGLHGLSAPKESRSFDLGPVIAGKGGKRRSAVFGVFTGPIGVTDGTHVLYHVPDDMAHPAVREHTLMPAQIRSYFTNAELRTARLEAPFDFTKGVPLLSYAALPDAARFPTIDGIGFVDPGSQIYDLARDPDQTAPVDSPEIAGALRLEIARCLTDHDAPASVFEWYGIAHPMDLEPAT